MKSQNQKLTQSQNPKSQTTKFPAPLIDEQLDQIVGGQIAGGFAIDLGDFCQIKFDY